MNGLLKVRLVKVLALGVLLSASTMAMAGNGNDRDRSNGHSDRYQGQQHDYDRNRSNGRSDRHRGQQYGGKHYNKHDRKHGRKHHNNRYYARHNRYKGRHRHNGRYCHVGHYPGYAAPYGAPVFLPRPPPVVLYPPRVGIYFGGRIDF